MAFHTICRGGYYRGNLALGGPAGPETPPATPAEAVERARASCAFLKFGGDVDGAVQGLAKDAGPPPKILECLLALNDLARLSYEGPIGTSVISWLQARNVDASRESGTVRGSTEGRRRRTWDDGTGRRVFFDYHLKPNGSTTPARCVRIYFRFEGKGAAGRIVVGSVGRHP